MHCGRGRRKEERRLAEPVHSSPALSPNRSMGIPPSTGARSPFDVGIAAFAEFNSPSPILPPLVRWTHSHTHSHPPPLLSPHIPPRPLPVRHSTPSVAFVLCRIHFLSSYTRRTRSTRGRPFHLFSTPRRYKLTQSRTVSPLRHAPRNTPAQLLSQSHLGRNCTLPAFASPRPCRPFCLISPLHRPSILSLQSARVRRRVAVITPHGIALPSSDTLLCCAIGACCIWSRSS